jgi:hypothetical protein
MQKVAASAVIRIAMFPIMLGDALDLLLELHPWFWLVFITANSNFLRCLSDWYSVGHCSIPNDVEHYNSKWCLKIFC